jgi:class 3 adenylate cyclase
MDQVQEAAVLFVDVSGSTKLYETAGDAVALKAIEGCISLFTRKTEASHGRVIKTIGDEVMAVFPSANDAADAAIEMQAGVEELPLVGGTKLGIRVGFYHGPVVERDGDVFGDTVNLAARLTGLATRGQIITARETVDQLPTLLKAACRELYGIQVKGKANEVKLCEVLWQQGEDATTMATGRTIAKAEKQPELRLRYGDQEIVIDAKHPVLNLGRDQGQDLVIRERMASRTHGKIEMRRDKFVLVDHSANGTYVQVDGNQEILLRREELTLHGQGIIAFGQSCASSPEPLKFQCQG